MANEGMPTNYTAVWSAVAASFSALSAFLVMLIQRRNLMESVRPELILLDWTREKSGGTASIHEIITFRKIRNVGRGAAFNVSITETQTLKEGDTPNVIIPGFRTAVIAPNESLDVAVMVGVAWKNIKSKGSVPTHKSTFINIKISFTDARDVRHFTEYTAFAASPPEAMGGLTDGDLAPGLTWLSRHTIRKPIWRLKTVENIRQTGKAFMNRLRLWRLKIVGKIRQTGKAFMNRLRLWRLKTVENIRQTGKAFMNRLRLWRLKTVENIRQTGKAFMNRLRLWRLKTVENIRQTGKAFMNRLRRIGRAFMNRLRRKPPSRS